MATVAHSVLKTMSMSFCLKVIRPIAVSDILKLISDRITNKELKSFKYRDISHMDGWIGIKEISDILAAKEDTVLKKAGGEPEIFSQL